MNKRLKNIRIFGPSFGGYCEVVKEDLDYLIKKVQRANKVKAKLDKEIKRLEYALDCIDKTNRAHYEALVLAKSQRNSLVAHYVRDGKERKGIRDKMDQEIVDLIAKEQLKREKK